MDSFTNNFDFFARLNAEKQDVHTLLEKLDQKPGDAASTLLHLFAAPLDRVDAFFRVDDALTDTMAAKIQDTSMLYSLYAMLNDYFIASSSRPRLGQLDRNYALVLRQIGIPDSIKPLPGLKAAFKALNEVTFSVTFHSQSGYNFSRELTDVYRVRNTKQTYLGNCEATCKRAIASVQPIIDDDSLNSYYRYIMQASYWETQNACELACSALKKYANDLKIKLQHRDESSPSIRVYVGQIDGELTFWIRIRLYLEDSSDAIVALAESAERGNNAAAKDELKRAHKLEDRSYLCSYVRYSLSKGALKQFNRAYEDGTFPPPPESSSLHSDAFPRKENMIYWMVPTNKRMQRYLRESENTAATANRVGSEGEDEEDDEEENVMHEEDVGMDESVISDTSFVDNSEPSSVTPSIASVPLSAPNKAAKDAADVRGKSNTELSDPSPCSELVGWGANDTAALGIGAVDRVYEPRPVPLPPSVCLERIAMIACSARHTLLMTCLGGVYCCGDNSEGALGTGDTLPRAYFTIVNWQTTASRDSPRIVKVSAGSGAIGSHSVAIDAEGKLYSWGVPQACGHGHTKPTLQPTLVEGIPWDAVNPSIKTDADEQELEDGDEDEDASVPCIDVACGGGFTVAVFATGRVCSWGNWSHGRIGQGDPPLVKSKGRFRRPMSKLAKYQLRPVCLQNVKHAVKVACGEAHSLVLLRSGRVMAWGQNSCGQVGTGPTPSGFLLDATRPVFLPSFTRTVTSNPESIGPDGGGRTTNRVTIRSVTAGSFHSIAIDAEGNIWSWGARGHPCLGHCDSPIEGTWTDKVNAIFSPVTGETEVMVPYELMQWCACWSIPRRVEAAVGLGALQVSAGDSYSAALCDDGRLYMFGTGAVVPPYISQDMMNLDEEGDDEDDDEDDDDENVKPLESPAVQAAKRKERAREKQAERMAKYAVAVSAPRTPSASWLPTICTRRAAAISSGGCSVGSRIFVLMEEETVSPSMTSGLLHQLIFGNGDPLKTTSGDDQDDVYDDASLASHTRSDDASVGSYFDNHGKADCAIIAGGKVLLAHRAVLAQRSSELRDMIDMESPAVEDSEQPTQILLPQLQVDAAKALLYYVYTDTLPRYATGKINVLQSLARTGNTLKMPRLQLLCESILRVLNAADSASIDTGSAISSSSVAADFYSIDPMRIDKAVVDLPPCTLARDLGSLVGDDTYADIRFIAEGKTLSAHRFVLEHRSEYFKLMLRSGMMSAQSMPLGGKVDVVVPDSFVGFLRLLIFLYTDTLPAGADGVILEDLMAADRYQVPQMRVLCENMLVPTKYNWLDLLRAANMLNAQRLFAQTVAFVRDNFSVLLLESDPLDDDENTTVAAEAGDHDDESAVTAASQQKESSKHHVDKTLDPQSETESVSSARTSKQYKQDMLNTIREIDEDSSVDASVARLMHVVEEVEGASDLQLLNQEFPGLLEKILFMRKISFPLPAPQTALLRAKEATKESTENEKMKPFPYAAFMLGIGGFVLYQAMKNVIVLNNYIPIINAVYIAAVAYYSVRYGF